MTAASRSHPQAVGNRSEVLTHFRQLGSLSEQILDDFRQKYFENREMGVGPSRARFDSGDRVAIKITPVRDLPDGFSSNPGTPPPLAVPPFGVRSVALSETKPIDFKRSRIFFTEEHLIFDYTSKA